MGRSTSYVHVGRGVWYLTSDSLTTDMLMDDFYYLLTVCYVAQDEFYYMYTHMYMFSRFLW